MSATVRRVRSPATDLRLARLHLRMGQLALARAELEALAGSGDLDDEGLLALAEARWRTGDLAGAGEAARAYLDAGGDATIALVIAAEAVADGGRAGEARRLARRALERADIDPDAVFAGMPRSMIWPIDPADASHATATLFGSDGSRRSAPARPRSGAVRDAPATTVAAAPIAPAPPEGPGLWDDDGQADELPPPGAMLDDAIRDLEAGRSREAGLRLAIVLRAAPQLAPAILSATDPDHLRSPEIAIVRGDAFRLVGREMDAARAFGAAASGLRPTRDPAADGG